MRRRLVAALGLGVVATIAAAVVAQQPAAIEVVDLDTAAPFAVDWQRAAAVEGPRWIAYALPRDPAVADGAVAFPFHRQSRDRLPLGDHLPPGEGRDDGPLVMIAVDGREDALRVADAEATEPAYPFDLAGRRRVLWIGDATPEASLELLLGLFDHAADERAMGDLAEAIGVHDAPRAAAFLAGLLADRGRPARLRDQAAEALGQQRAPVALRALDRAAWDDPDRRIRAEALESLARLPGDTGLETLVRTARNHPDEATRRDAIEALADVAARREGRRGRRALESLLEG